MATNQLKQAYEKAEKLSLKDQDMLAEKILEIIEEMESDEKWEELLAQPVVKGTAMWEIEERAKADMADGRVKEWKPGESFEALFQ